MSVNTDIPWGTTGASLVPNTGTYRTSYYHTSGNVYNTYTNTVDTRFVKKTRSSVGSPAFINGWRYSRPYTAEFRNLVKTSRGSRATDNGILKEVYTQYSAGDLSYLNQISLSDPGISAVADQLQASAVTQALARLNDSQIELGVSLLEAHKTLGHLASTATRLMSVIRNMRRGNFGAVAKDLGLSLSLKGTRDLAKNWLEYQYAWRPLVSDVYATYGIAQQGLERDLTVKAVRDVSDSVSFPYRKVWTKQSYDANNWRGVLTQEQCDIRIGVKVTLHARMSNPELAKLKALGLANPASIAWELTPWSFVVDWFVPVGNFLDACTATQGLQFVDGCITRYLSYEDQYESMDGSALGEKQFPFFGGQIQAQVKSMSRTSLTSFPRPVLYGQRHLATNKIVTAAALWRNLR